MAGEVAARKLNPQTGLPIPPRRPVPVYGGGPPADSGRPRLSNARIAIAMFLGAETMFFTGLIGAYMVLRQASPAWPPPGLPRLPIAVTWANTAALMFSCWTMWRANQAVRMRSPRRLERALSVTCLLGIVFVGVQGSEWIRLVAHGLKVSSGVYGSTFYVLIGVHGLHVLGAVLWLLGVLFRARSNRFSMANAKAVSLVSIYWYYVGGLWLVLFPMVYLV